MIEEAPAAILPETARMQLQQAAVSLLSRIRYRNAGTVEFLYDEPTQQFFFMEVNARLQVEHPVSEFVTGVDLVRVQLLLATETGALPPQSAVRVSGHAIEARILAEDPNRDFLPCPGRVTAHANSRLRSEEHTSELQSRSDLVCRLLLEKKKI